GSGQRRSVSFAESVAEPASPPSRTDSVAFTLPPFFPASLRRTFLPGLSVTSASAPSHTTSACASVRLLSLSRLATLRETARRTVPPSTAWQLSEIVSLPLRNAFSVDCERRTSFSATQGVGFGAGSPPGGLPDPPVGGSTRLNATCLVGSGLPATSTERYSTRCSPSAVTVNGAV